MRVRVAALVVWALVVGVIAVHAGWVRAPFTFVKYLYHRNLPPILLFGGGAALFAVVVVTPFGDRRRAPLRLAAAALLWLVLLVLFHDQRHQLGDSNNLLRDPVRRIGSGGWYTFYDELVGMWLPLRLARVAVEHLGLEARTAILYAYRALSWSCGLAFFFVAHRLANTLPSPRFAMLLLLGAAHSLQFAGYVENYQLSSLLLTLGFLVVVERSVKPTPAITVLFAAAVVCHAVSVWSVLALVYLAARRGRFVRTAAVHSAIGLALIAAVAALFALWLTPGVGFAHAHASTLLDDFGKTLATRSLAEHANQLGRTAAAPIVAIVLALVATPRAALTQLRTPEARFAGLYLAGFLVHQLVWKSTLGMAADWDLFGYTWLPLVYLAARVTPRYLPLELGLAILQAGLGWSWLLAQGGR